MYNFNQNVHVCVVTEMCRKIYAKYTTKEPMTSEHLLYQKGLQHVSHSANNEDKYICTSCDKRLQETSNKNPVLPYYGKIHMQ